jgi:LacI family transcriptional regulator
MAQQKSVNIKELSAKLNLSVTTVSRVLNGKAKQYRIKEETEKKVREAALEVNYSPNRFARGLKLDKSETIGVIVPDISNPFFADMVKIIEEQLRGKGYAILIGDSNEKTEQEAEMICLFESRKVDGLIVAPVGLQFDHLERIYLSGKPLVVIDRTQPDLTIPAITSDNYSGAYQAVLLLVEYGHRNIACVQGLKNSQSNNDRVAGFIDAMKYSAIDEEHYKIVGHNFSIDSGYIHGKDLLTAPGPPTAILALNNSISLGILKAVAELEINIPGDLSLISFDEQSYSAYLNTPMTTIEQDKKQIGKMAVERLIDQIEGTENQNFGEVIRIPTKINPRKSLARIKV